MKIAEQLNIKSPSGSIDAFAGGENSLTVNGSSRTLIRFGRISAGGFQETLSLPEKLRRHFANDALSAELESINTIPFGCEYRVRRVWTVFDGIAMLNCDIAADNGGRITDLELEPVIFPFKPVSLQYFVFGDNELQDINTPADGVVYCGREPVIMLRAGSADGDIVEFYAGDDFWRHRAAAGIPGAEAEHTVSVTEEGVVLTRKVLMIPDDITTEKRPWRFKSLLAWKKNTGAYPFDGREIKIDGCFANSVPRRILRDTVRKSSEDTLLYGKFPNICTESAHLDRSANKAVEHGDLTELATDYLWANRELNKRGKKFAVKAENKIFGDSVALANLASPLAPLED